MKGKIIIAAAVLLLLGLAVVFWKPPSGGESQSGEGPSAKSDFSNSDSLPGFKSRRGASSSVPDAEELKPLNPPSDSPRVVVKEGHGLEDFTPEQIAQIEERQREIAEISARNGTAAFEVKLADLVKGLDLDGEQENALRAHFASIQGDIASGDLQAYGVLAQALQGDGLDGVLEEVLTPAQWELHQSAHERMRAERADSAAATEMNHLSSLLTLSKEQQVQVQEVLQAEALKKELAGQAATSSEEQTQLTNKLMEHMQSAEAGTNPLEVLIQGRIAQRRESVLGQLEGILNEEQLAKYRQSLIARDGDMSQFRNSLEAFQKGGSR